MDGNFAPIQPTKRASFRTLALLITAIVLGATLRLMWGDDIEHKLDEAYLFHSAQNLSEIDNPWLGMPTSHRFPNPGLSTWIFAAPTQWLNLSSPVELARFVQISNVLAILLLLWFSWRWVPREEREPWLWAVALVCLNPMAVLFHRKIWPPSVLPFFSVLLLMSWWKRESRLGSFFWGLLAVLMLQIHLGGLFYAGGIFLWSFFFSRSTVRWKWWLLGSCLAALPMIPWLAHLLTMTHDSNGTTFQISRWFELKFWTHWATEPFGIGLKYSLSGNFNEFLRYPLLDGRPTYLMAGLHGLILLITVGSLALALRGWLKQKKDWRNWLSGGGSRGRMIVQAVVVGYGILFTLAALRFYRHYLVLTFPFMYVWAAIVILKCNKRSRFELRLRRLTLSILCVAQLVLTITFMSYIHNKGGAPLGDYRWTYRAQMMTWKSQGGIQPTEHLLANDGVQITEATLTDRQSK